MSATHQRDDAALAAETVAGNTASFGQLVRRYQDLVYRMVVNLLVDRHEAEDVAQEVFVAAFTNLSTFNPERAPFRAWLLAIARNKCLNFLKRRRPRGLESIEPADEQSPAAKLAQREFFELLDQALARLPFDLRAAFVFAEIEGMSYEETAVVESILLGTVKSRGPSRQSSLAKALAARCGVTRCVTNPYSNIGNRIAATWPRHTALRSV